MGPGRRRLLIASEPSANPGASQGLVIRSGFPCASQNGTHGLERRYLLDFDGNTSCLTGSESSLSRIAGGYIIRLQRHLSVG